MADKGDSATVFDLIIQLGLVETYLGAILPLAAHPIGIFFMRQYMLSIEDELLDAARVDGANEYRMFFSVVLPNVRPAVATLLILFALEYWNNLLWPLIVFRQAQNMPLTVGIQSLVSQYRVQYDLVMAQALSTRRSHPPPEPNGQDRGGRLGRAEHEGPPGSHQLHRADGN